MAKKGIALLLAAVMSIAVFAAPALAKEDGGVTLYGFRCSDDENSGGSSNAFISFSTTEPDKVNVLSGQPSLPNVYCGTYFNGKFYGVDSEGKLFSAQGDSYTRTEIAQVVAETDKWNAAEMTYDYTTGTTFLLLSSRDSNDPQRQLHRLNLDTGDTEYVGTITKANQLRTLACDPDGQLYGIDGSGVLFRVDKQTGACVQVGDTGKPCAYIQSMCFDRTTGKLYWAQYNGNGFGRLVLVDPETAKAQDAGQIGANCEVSGLFLTTDAFMVRFEAETGGFASVKEEGLYLPGEMVALTAEVDKGYKFGGWESLGGGTFTSTQELETTFVMPAQDVTIRAYFVPEKAYMERTLRDVQTGSYVIGNKVYYNAEFTVDALAEDAEGYAEMKAEIGKETLLFAYDAAVSAFGTEKAPFTGKLTATFKVDEQYNGQKLSVYRYVDGKVEHSNVKVKDGEVTLKLDSFGPMLFATHGGMSLWLVFLIVILVIVGVLVAGFAALCIRAQIIRRRKRMRRMQRRQP